MKKTIRLTVGQAIVRFLDQQYVSFDGLETKFVQGVFTVFGHGIVLGLGQALDENPGNLLVYQGKNEQGMAHAAVAFAKQSNRRRIIACASSIGPGSANMVTAAALASINEVPLLILAGDSFSTRQPDPVLQQLERPYDPTVTTNDAFRPVCKWWDRIDRPEKVMSSLMNAMRVLTDPSNTGAVCLALPQDVQAEAFSFPLTFFTKRIHVIVRPPADATQLQTAANLLRNSKRPLVICGGGVRYSEAGDILQRFCEHFAIPMAETQAGKSAISSSFPGNLGGIGVTGNLAANTIAAQADTIVAVGTRLTDFTTGSKELINAAHARVITINTSPFHAAKLEASCLVGDAKVCLQELDIILHKKGYKAHWGDKVAQAKLAWEHETHELYSIHFSHDYEPLIAARDPRSIPDFIEATGGTIPQTTAIGIIRRNIAADAIIVGAAGSLPGDLQRLWTTDVKDSYHMEYGYSCMGYEIAGALGAKLACPERDVYALVGDGSYLMLHSELITSLQEGKKINVLLFDNASFGCINNLQMENGIRNLATERRRRPDDGEPIGDFLPIDFAMSASGYGVKTYTAHTEQELIDALQGSRHITTSTLIDIKVLPKSMTPGYAAWWHVGTASVSASEEGRKAYYIRQAHLKKASLY